MYYVAPETPMMSSVIADCPDLAPPNILDKSTPVRLVAYVLCRMRKCIMVKVGKSWFSTDPTHESRVTPYEFRIGDSINLDR